MIKRFIYQFLFLAMAIVLVEQVHAQRNGRSHSDEAKPVKVFILAGQSNMEGKATVALLQHQMMQPETEKLFAHLHRDGELVEREDVHIKFLDRNGKLTAGFGSPNRIGPELQFGFSMGERYDEPVLLIKTAWGGKSLFRDFRPPSAGLPDGEMLQSQLVKEQKRHPETTLDETKDSYGFYYREMLKEIQATLDGIGDFVPRYDAEVGYELAGFVWFQGWNDMMKPDFVAAYTENMAHFIRDVRKDLGQPRLPFVVGVLGVGGVQGERVNEKKSEFKRKQAAVGEMDEFKGNVAIVHTDQYWDVEADAVFTKGWKENLDEWKQIGSDRPYHYLGSVKCYNRIGGAFAEALLDLIDDKNTTLDSVQEYENFLTKNLVAWCIVPFDAKNRGPAERAEMVRELGFNRVAYDWREKHIPEFEQEIIEYKKNGLEYFAFWNWHESMAPLIRKYQIQPQIWDMFRGKLPEGTEEEKTLFVVQQFLPKAQRAQELGLKFGIYSHGGWAGKPENLVAVCESLRSKHGLSNVGIVYSFHHGHDDIADFSNVFATVQPFLLCLNLNGMADPETVNRRTHANQILTIGKGLHEADMIREVIKAGYDGPIGIIGHRADVDAKESLGANLVGLEALLNDVGDTPDSED
ncbi:sialate O-acetylesterase [Mariniblastus sp.]|nr:sialate O-acetylesterase [Mariniblastus sp.]